MTKEFHRINSASELGYNILLICFFLILSFGVIASYRMLNDNPTPFIMLLFIWVINIVYDIRWLTVLKYRQIKSIKCDLETLDITLTTMNDEKIDSNLSEVKYNITSLGSISDLRIKNKNYFGVRYLGEFDQMRGLINKHCHRIL